MSARAVSRLIFSPVLWLLTGLLLIHWPVQALELPGRLGKLLLFPTLQFQHHTRSPDSLDTPKNLVNPLLSVFYTVKFKQFLFVTESVLARDEQEIERFQFGWQMQPNTRLWFGRFHNPLGYWNTQYHHGFYLQPSIRRPSIAEFEDEGGPIPMHISGVLFNKTVLADGQLFEFDLGLGAGPSLESGEFEPVSVIDPLNGTHRFSVTGRLVYQTDPVLQNQLGVFSGFS